MRTKEVVARWMKNPESAPPESGWMRLAWMSAMLMREAIFARNTAKSVRPRNVGRGIVQEDLFK